MIYEGQIGLEEVNDEYASFLDKFKPKKSTDDCYTPPNIYEAVKAWAMKEYNIPSDATICRPFYPNGDYERYDYPEGCYVIDNPPFSILSQICRFYQKHGVRFFLFAPSLTSILNIGGVCAVVAACTITYENGANVVTSFETNLEDGVVLRSAPDLHDSVEEVNKENERKKSANFQSTNIRLK